MDNENIDYEKLRKKLVALEFAEGLMNRGIGAENCVNAYNATQEQLLSIARRAGINLDKYKIK